VCGGHVCACRESLLLVLRMAGSLKKVLFPKKGHKGRRWLHVVCSAGIKEGRQEAEGGNGLQVGSQQWQHRRPFHRQQRAKMNLCPVVSSRNCREGQRQWRGRGRYQARYHGGHWEVTERVQRASVKCAVKRSFSVRQKFRAVVRSVWRYARPRLSVVPRSAVPVDRQARPAAKENG